MDIGEAFKTFCLNLLVKNRTEISERYRGIAKVLNGKYWDSPSDLEHCSKAGSFGRGTAIVGTKKFDVIFLLPSPLFERYSLDSGNAPSGLLREIRDTIRKTHSRTNVSSNGDAVDIHFRNLKIVFWPAFQLEGRSFLSPDAKNGGSWKANQTQAEVEEITRLNNESNGNLKRLCRLMRAWKANNAVGMEGVLVDTLCYEFFRSTDTYFDGTDSRYDLMVRDFLAYLCRQEGWRHVWSVPGGDRKIRRRRTFVPRAARSHGKCLQAIKEGNSRTAWRMWKSIFGRAFPTPRMIKK